MKLELKHLAPYLPFSLDLIFEKSGRIITMLSCFNNGKLQIVDTGEGNNYDMSIWNFKPLLYSIDRFEEFENVTDDLSENEINGLKNLLEFKMEQIKISDSEKMIYKGKIYLLSQLNQKDLSLTSSDRLVLMARLSGNSIIQFPVDEGMEALKRILHNACAISGLGLPNNLKIAESLKSCLYNFILDFGYKVLNEEEFALAFNLNSIEQKLIDGTIIPPVEPTGDFISVLYCSRVLSNYMIQRLIFDRKMQNVIDGYDNN